MVTKTHRRNNHVEEMTKGLVIIMLLFLVYPGVHGQTNETRPNIIYILVDDLGYGDLGCYGQQKIKTPHIDQLANDGMMFTQHYAANTVCAPSRASLMTGLHAGHCRVRGNGDAQSPWANYLKPEDQTVAEVLANEGYSCGIVGKWGLGDEPSGSAPLQQGFDYFFGYQDQIRAHNYYPEFLIENYDTIWLENKVEYAKEGYASGVGSVSNNRKEYSHELFTKKAIEFIRDNKEDPFFLYLAYTIPHANNEFALKYEHGMEVPDYGPYVDKDWPEAEKGFAAMLHYLDLDVHKIRKELMELGIDENTMLVFTSDNGPHQEGAHDPMFFNSTGGLKGVKRDVYEGGVRVPLIITWPNTVKPASTTDHISVSYDFYSTICDILGKRKDAKHTDGLSYYPSLRGKRQPDHHYLYWEYVRRWLNDGNQAVRMGKWKAVRRALSENPDQTFELYNLEDDPSESNDVASDYPKVVNKIRQIVKKAHTPCKTFSFRYELSGLD